MYLQILHTRYSALPPRFYCLHCYEADVRRKAAGQVGWCISNIRDLGGTRFEYGPYDARPLSITSFPFQC